MEVHPDALVCPILGSIMADPVVAEDGHTYERSAILEWYKSSRISPMTGLTVETKSLIPNHALRKTIDDYCRNRPDRMASRESSRNPEFLASKISSKSRRIQPFNSSEGSEPWEFDKKLLATSSVREKKPIILTASRTSLYSGEGVLVAFEPTTDGNEFNVAFTQQLKLDKLNTADASIACMQRMSDDTFACGMRNGSVSVWKLDRNSSGGKLATKKIWQAESDLHMDETTCISFVNAYDLLSSASSGSSLDGFIATGSRDRTVKLWKADKSKNTWSLAECVDHRAEVKCVLGLREGHVVSGGSDWSLKVWDPNTPEDPVRVLDGHSRSVRCVTMERTGQRLASGSDDEHIIIWDFRASDPIVHQIDTGSPVLTIHWGDNFLCAGGGTANDSMSGSSKELMGGWLRFFDPRMWQTLSDAVIPRAKSRFPVVKAGPDGEKVIRARSAHPLATVGLASTVLAGNKAVISGGDDKMIRIWVSPPLSEDPFSPRPTMAYELGGEKVIPIATDAIVTLFA